MSPSEPVPKSVHPRHVAGRYVGLKSRRGAVPSNRFQSISLGISNLPVGVAIPCGQTGLFVHTCTVCTSPINPPCIHVSIRRVSSPLLPWFPICVTTLNFL